MMENAKFEILEKWKDVFVIRSLACFSNQNDERSNCKVLLTCQDLTFSFLDN